MVKKLTAIRMKEDVHKELKIWAVKQDMSIGDLIEHLLKIAGGESGNVPADKTDA
jgi:predicted HicB family RNase H-like nuclease